MKKYFSPLKITFCVLFLACIFKVNIALGSPPEHMISFYHDEEFITPQDNFFAYDTIYTVIDFQALQPGAHQLNIDWIRPDGKLVRNSSYEFSLENPVESYRAFFWLKLHPRGPLRQLVSGGEYPTSVFGPWKVKLTFNGAALNPASFSVVDDGL